MFYCCDPQESARRSRASIVRCSPTKVTDLEHEKARTDGRCGPSFLWSRLGSNQRPSACEADALPLSHGTERGKTLTRGVAANRIACRAPKSLPPYLDSVVTPLISHRSQVPNGLILQLTTRFVSFTPVGLMFSPHHGDSNCPAVIASGVRGCGAVVAHHLAKVRVAGSNPVIRSRVSTHGGVAEW